MNKHAYLIMAHTDFDVLEKLIMAIDDSRNDIYLHVDKKAKNFDCNHFQKLVKKSNLYFTKRTDVRWGSYSQINTEYLLFKMAYKNHYKYYHVLSGACAQIVSQDEIHNYFDKHQGKEFVTIDNHKEIAESALERVKLYHFLVPWARSKHKLLRKIFGIIHFRSLKLERNLKINRLKNISWKFRKGANWVSITDDFVGYILSKEKEVKKIFKHSYCADELFIQTLLYNSDFYKNIISLKNDDYLAIKRYVDWNRGQPYTFKDNDYEEIINSDYFWVRKVSSKESSILVQKLYNRIKENDND